MLAQKFELGHRKHKLAGVEDHSKLLEPVKQELDVLKVFLL